MSLRLSGNNRFAVGGPRDLSAAATVASGRAVAASGRLARRRVGRWLASAPTLVLTATMLVACSATRLAYDNADFLLLRWVDRYIEPTDSQDQILEAGLSDVLKRHRAELLPDYLRYLRGSADVVADGLTSDEVRCLVTSFEELYRRTVELIAPLAATVLADLDRKQIEQLRRRLEKDDDRFVRNWLQKKRQERLAKRAARFVEKIEDWTGELYARQTQQLTRSTLAFPDTAPGWYAYRQSQQSELLRLVRETDDAELIELFLHHWWLGQTDVDERLGRQIDEAVERFIEMIVELDGTLTREQRDRVVSRLESFADALEPSLNPDDQTVVAVAAQPAFCRLTGRVPDDLG